MIGKNIGRYKVKSELGRGGMATVFLAEDPLIGREVAVKVLPREFLHDPSFRGRFEREARTIAMLEHPAIVPIYDFGEQDGQPYLVMRFMKGGTLGDRIRKGSIPLEDTVRILERMGAALDHAHQNGIVHRDLKPGNILFDEFGEPYLSDFGIVKLAKSTATFTGQNIVGTPAYMSPEQVHGDKEIDGRSDLYTLGVILFEMLTGQMPFRADTPAKLMMAHVLNPVPRILEVRPDLPPECNEVLTRALAKEPDQRFSTGKDLAKALERARDRRTAAAGPARSSAAAPTIVDEAPAVAPQTPPLTPPPVSAARPATSVQTPAPPAAPSESPPVRRILIPALGLLGLIAVLCIGGFAILSLLPDDGESDDPALTATALALLESVSSTLTPTSGIDEDALTSAAALETTQAEEAAAATASRAADATGTAGAQAAAIETRIAESTRAVETRAAATATAMAPTRIAEDAIQLILRAQQNDPAFGPQDGGLVHVDDEFIESYYPEDFSARDLVVDVVFYNPYAADVNNWDFGLLFRETDVNSQFRLVIDSEGDWSLIDRTGDDSEFLVNDTYNGLNLGAGQPNRLTVYANGDTGYLFINGDYISALDLSSRTVAGRVGIATGIYEGDEVAGEETVYEQFTIWAP